MTSSTTSYASTKETTNYAHLCRLLVDVGSQAGATSAYVMRFTYCFVFLFLSLHINRIDDFNEK